MKPPPKPPTSNLALAPPASAPEASAAPDASKVATRQRASKVRAKRWHEDNHRKHVRATEALRVLLQNLLEQAHVPLVSVTGRAKTLTSYVDKAISKKEGKRRYKDPAKQILDVCGLRVVTYFDSTTKKVDTLIREEFEVDEANSMDKTKALGTDRVGYRSVHYIARLKEPRSKLAEYRDLVGMPFEIQVRSILQHAWAEIEHDRRFKPGVESALPPELQRRFALLAGVLEVLDRDFDQLAIDVDEHNKAIVNAPPGPLVVSTPLTLDVLTSYLSGLFQTDIVLEVLDPSASVSCLKELKAFGVETLEALRELVNSDFDRKYPWATINNNFTGLLRIAMILKDASRYFEKAWLHDWTEIDWDKMDRLVTAGVPIEIFIAHGLSLQSTDVPDDGPPDDDLQYDEDGYPQEPNDQPPE